MPSNTARTVCTARDACPHLVRSIATMPRPAEQVAKLEKILEWKTEQYNALLKENTVLKQRELALQAHIIALSQASTPWRDPCTVDSHTHQHIACFEAAIDNALTQLGCTYHHSPVQGVLSKLQQRPDRASTVSSMSFSERAAVFKKVVHKLAVLLPKVQHSADGQWAQALQSSVESIIEMQLLMTFWDPQSNKTLNLAEINIDTLEPQKCPKELVIEACKAMNLTDDQRTKLKAAWASSTACRAALLADFEKTSAALLQLQQRRQSEQQQFMLQAEQLPTRRAPHWLLQAWSNNSNVFRSSSNRFCSSPVGGSEGVDSSGPASGKDQPQCSVPATPATTGGVGTSSTELPRDHKCPATPSSSCSESHVMPQAAAATALFDSVQLVPSSDEQKLERRLHSITERLKFLAGVHGVLLFNTLSSYQIALGFVMHYPWLPTSLSVLEAWEAIDWQ